MTQPVTHEVQAARTLTDRIKVAVEGTLLLIQDAYTSRAWAALGYDNWDSYCAEEFGASRLRLPREERQEVVASLRESGLSLRAIAAATGSSTRTVQQDLQEVWSETTPAEIVGTDGRSYASSHPQPAPDPMAQHSGGDWLEPDADPFDEQDTEVPAARPAEGPLNIGPDLVNAAGRRMQQRSQRKALSSGIANLTGLCVGFEAIEEIDPSLDAEEAARWTRDLSKAASVIRRLNTKLKEHTNASH